MSPTAIVTGAARGIGAAIAERLMTDGHDVLLVDLSSAVVETAERLAAARRGSAWGLPLDINDTDAPQVIAGCCEAGRVKVLVNNAGITRDAMVEKMTEDDFLAVLRVNLGGAYALAMAAIPVLGNDSAIVNVSSKSANGNFGQFNYAVSKAGLIGLTRSLALLLAPRVRVNAIAPAFTHTEMTDAIPHDVRAKVVSRIPFGRGAQPSEIADVVAWLASPQASYVTGQVVAACGGRSFG